LKKIRFDAKIYSIDTKTKTVELVDCQNIGEYKYVEVIEPILMQAMDEDRQVKVLASDENEKIMLIKEATLA